MSIAEGFESGFNLALKARAFKTEEEERKRKMSLEEEKLDIERQTFGLKEQELESVRLRNEAMMRSYDASAQLNEARAAGQINQNQFDELTEGKSTKARGWKQVNALLNRLNNLPSDPVAREEELYFISGGSKALKDEFGIDIFEVLSPKTELAYKNIDPILQSGDFSLFGPEYKDDLTQIYQHDLNQFKGRNFASKDGREGKIKKIQLTGGFSAADEGQASLIEALYTVDVNGQEETFTGFLPDSKTGVVKEDIEGTDAKAVSVSDAIDVMSALRTITFSFQDKPDAYELAKERTKYNIDLYDDKDPTEKDKQDNVTIRQIYTSLFENYTDQKAIATEDTIDFSAPASSQPEAVDAAIRRFSVSFPNLVTETNDDGRFVIPKEYNGNIGKYFATMQPRYEDTVRMVNNSGSFETGDLKENQKPLYIFSNKAIKYDENKNSYISTLKDIYPTDDIDRLLDQGISLDLTDEELLDFLHTQLTNPQR
jgi:hypothetical protein